MDDARIAVETGMSLLTFRLVKMLIIGVDGVDVVIGTSSFLREHSHGKDMTWITKTSAISSSNATKS
jgi:homocitrate synthase